MRLQRRVAVLFVCVFLFVYFAFVFFLKQIRETVIPGVTEAKSNAFLVISLSMFQYLWPDELWTTERVIILAKCNGLRGFQIVL